MAIAQDKKSLNITFDGSVSSQQLGELRVATKAQLQSRLNAADYSAEKQQAIQQQQAQVTQRAMQFVGKQRDLAQTAAQQRPSASSHNLATVAGQQQKASSIFERYAANDNRKAAPQQTQTQATNLQQVQQNQQSRSIFERYAQQRQPPQQRQQSQALAVQAAQLHQQKQQQTKGQSVFEKHAQQSRQQHQNQQRALSHER